MSTRLSHWDPDELNKIGKAEEVKISPTGSDGTQRKPVTTWIVRVDDDLFVRSVNGRSGHWFRAAQQRREGWIRAGGLQKDVSFLDAERDLYNDIDEAYRAKYNRYAGAMLNGDLTAKARSATLKLVPR